MPNHSIRGRIDLDNRYRQRLEWEKLHWIKLLSSDASVWFSPSVNPYGRLAIETVSRQGSGHDTSPDTRQFPFRLLAAGGRYRPPAMRARYETPGAYSKSMELRRRKRFAPSGSVRPPAHLFAIFLHPSRRGL
jgi:hypothetical protein